MAQIGFDKLMTLTDSRYRLSMIVARRAAQLKAGIPSTLPSELYPKTRNTVTIAMKELELGLGIVWGEDLPSMEELRQMLERERRQEEAAYTISRQARDEDDEDEEDEEE
jgi:DNA-directed RNA polymerase subunit omega